MRSLYLRSWIVCSLLAGFCAIPRFAAAAKAPAAESGDAVVAPSPSPERGSVSLSPAVAVVNCKLGQSYTQELTIINQTSQELVFEMVARDLVVRDGKRVFVTAGETPNGIAFTGVFSQKQVIVEPWQSASVTVTFTLPLETPLRAAVAVFQGTTKLSARGSVKMTASLGTLFTFVASQNFKVDAAPLVVTAQSANANLGLTDLLENTGSEPVVSDGVAAVVDQAGAIVGKTSFEPQRLLPGERIPFHAEYSAELKPGRYRVLASFQYEKKVITNSADFMVP